jgi:hypothetical protein
VMELMGFAVEYFEPCSVLTFAHRIRFCKNI